jgi:hypothetical protein
MRRNRMSNKETYAEYTKTFPEMVEQLRQSETHPDAKIYREFILDNEERMLEKAAHFATRKQYRFAADMLTQGCKLITEATPELTYRAWATKFYIEQLLVWRGKLKTKAWKKVIKLRSDYLENVLNIIEESKLDWPVVPKLRKWQALAAQSVEEAEIYDDYRYAANFLAGLGAAADLVMFGKGEEAIARLNETINTPVSAGR